LTGVQHPPDTSGARRVPLLNRSVEQSEEPQTRAVRCSIEEGEKARDGLASAVSELLK